MLVPFAEWRTPKEKLRDSSKNEFHFGHAWFQEHVGPPKGKWIDGSEARKKSGREMRLFKLSVNNWI